jgi:hypothetical protein
MPELLWNILAKALDIREQRYTFITPEFRIDIPHKAFAPLSKGLVAETGHPTIMFTPQPVSQLPELHWSGEQQQMSASRNSVPNKKHDVAQSPRTVQQDAASETRRRVGAAEQSSAVVSDEVLRVLQEQAEQFQQQQDYLSAAVCFALCGDSFNAARCYQSAAQALTTVITTR